MKTIAFFNNKGGTGKTTLAFHLAHMLPRLGYPTLAVDLDPQGSLSAAFFGEERLEEIWQSGEGMVAPSLEPFLVERGDLLPTAPIEVAEGLHVLAGDIRLSSFEERFSAYWSVLLRGNLRPLEITTAIYRLIKAAAEAVGAAVTLLDLGPGLGSLNRASLLAADRVLFPLAADLFSVVGLNDLGSTLREWRQRWEEVLKLHAAKDTPAALPAGDMAPLGYVILQHNPRRSSKWIQRIPRAFREGILDEAVEGDLPENDPYHLATLRSYPGLMSMAQEAHKPVFDLKISDGALGSYASLAQKALQEFRVLADRIAATAGLSHPSQP